jgi:hypothetical protein
MHKAAATLLSIFLMVIVSVRPAAQGRGTAATLASATRVVCRFTTRARVSWQKGLPVVAVEPSTLALGFDEISPDDGTARAIDWVGPSDIIMRVADNATHFLQSSREGALYVTTIFPHETLEGRMRAVHTRHEFTPVSVPGFTSSPEQYYGDCAVTK